MTLGCERPLRSMRRWLTCSNVPVLAAGLIACGDAAEPAVPTRLEFTVQPPTHTTAGVAIAPAVQVTILDAGGNRVSSATPPITVALGPNSLGATLLGTKTVTAVAGVASFGDLAIDKAMIGHTLVASSGALTGATSLPFSIVQAAKTQLAVVAQPNAAAGGQPITLAVAVQDAFGNVVSEQDPVTVALGANPGAATLSGTLTVAAIAGVATFSDVRIDRPGSGYTLTVSSGPLTGATTAPFDVTLTFAALSPGFEHTCGVTTGNVAYCWGYNSNGQLGGGTTTSWSSPALVAGGLSFATVSAGTVHTCGLTAAGAAYCWGGNGQGQLGDGTTTSRLTPQLVAGGLSFASVSAGGFYTCAVTSAGAAYCWGLNSDGQLGDGTVTNRSSPVAVAGGLTFAMVTASRAGGDHTCGVTSAGAARCWGRNDLGQLGDGTTTNRLTPRVVAGGLSFAAVSAGEVHTCGHVAGAPEYCWGDNTLGQLGDGTTTTRLSPVAVFGVFAAPADAGGVHTCAPSGMGGVGCWGLNNFGQLGDGTTTTRLVPGLVTGGVSFAAVRGGQLHTCGVTAGGAAYCWGHNNRGQLGDGTTTDRLTPVRVVQ
jgi:alpha-tubulin suppressor-like RCC1 family protein